MTWDMLFNSTIMVFVLMVSSLHRAKRGPTEKERTGLEKKYGRTLTDEDIKYYKSMQKFLAILLIFIFVLLVVAKILQINGL